MTRIAILLFPMLLLVLIPMVSSQINIGNGQDCPDKCENSVLYEKGTWDSRLRQCIYPIQEQCRYGCEDDSRISKAPTCKEFPDKPPTNQTELGETSWEMIKRLYDRSRKEISMKVLGTEYISGDNATVFIQLLDDYKQAVNDASCYLTAYYPDKTNLLNDVLMTYLSGSDGLYYYDLVAPSMEGVYMLSVGCTIPGSAWIDDFADYSMISAYDNISIADSKVFLLSQDDIPNNQQVVVGGMNMTGNVLLFHLNNQSGYENNTHFFDFSGNGNNGSCSSPSCPIYTLGKINDALDFDGINDYVEVPNSATLDTSSGITVGGWFKPEGTYTQWMIPIAKGRTGWGNWSIGMNIDDGWALWHFTNSSGSGTWLGHYGQSLYDIGEWVFVVGTYDPSGNASIYIMNESSPDIFYKSTGIISGPLMYDSSAPVSLGIIDLTDKYYEGAIDEPFIMNRSMTPDEIYEIFNLTKGIVATNGWVISEPISLVNNTWLDYISEYAPYEGSISYSVLASNGSTLCTGLGNILPCAGSITPIRLAMNITMPTVLNITPEIDSWSVTYSTEGLEYQEVKGSGEMHINKWLDPITDLLEDINDTVHNLNLTCEGCNASLIAEYVWNFSDRSLTDYNFSEILDYLNQINVTVTSIGDKIDLLQIDIDSIIDFQVNELSNNLTEILLQLNYINTTTNRTYTYIQGMTNLSSFDVWSYYNRTLTETQDPINYSLMQEYVWNYTNRTLTECPCNLSEILEFLDDMNVTITDNQEEILDEILNLNLTATDIYNLILNLTLGNVTLQADVNWTEGELVLYNASSTVQGLAEVLRYQAQNVQVVTTTDTCADSVTLNHHVNSTNCIAENCWTNEFDSQEVCLYGCKNNICVPPPWMSIGLGLIIAIIISISVYWAWRRFE